ncbi:UNVERIFIED_CONTAM: hypothetical protein K2H54_055265 [Gekko kuhli]
MASGKRPRDADSINTPAPKQSKLEDFFPFSGTGTAVYNVETTNRFTPLESLGEEGEEGGGIKLLEGSVTSLRDSPQKVQCCVSGEEGEGVWDSLLDNQTTLIARTVRSIFECLEVIANQADQLRARVDDVVELLQPEKSPDRYNGLWFHNLPQRIQTVVANNLPADCLLMEEVRSDKRDHHVFKRKCVALTIPIPSLIYKDKNRLISWGIYPVRVFENLMVKLLIRTKVKQRSKEGPIESFKLQAKQLIHEEPNSSREALPSIEANGGGYHSAPTEEQPMEGYLLNSSSEEEFLISFGDLIVKDWP